MQDAVRRDGETRYAAVQYGHAAGREGPDAGCGVLLDGDLGVGEVVDELLEPTGPGDDQHRQRTGILEIGTGNPPLHQIGVGGHPEPGASRRQAAP